VKLSVIIPVYRTERTLERCVKSILEQSYHDLEVILVDDGSPDNCPQLCDEWALKDSRIRVVHKPNGGLSDARNAGIDAATGDCLTFVDADDFLAPETYVQVMPKAAGSDIVEFPIYWHYTGDDERLMRFQPADYDDMGRYWLEGEAYTHTYACNKVFRRVLFGDVRFPKGRVFEDAATLPLLLEHARRVSTVDAGLYYYVANPAGITAQATGQELTMLLEHHLAVIPRWCDARYYLHVLNIQMDVCELTDAEPRLPAFSVSPLARRLSLKQRLKATILNLLGIKRICKLSKLLHLLKGKLRS
jgi:glycosyltransferase involved in cell wall biosynthesis